MVESNLDFQIGANGVCQTSHFSFDEDIWITIQGDHTYDMKYVFSVWGENN